MADFQDLVDDLERSYTETQERLSDPAVYNDHREAADVGRRLKELEGPHKLAQEWRLVSDDLEAARDDGDLRELVPELEERRASLEEELKLALVENDPADRKDVIVEIRQGVGGDEAAIWAGDVYRMLTRYAERRGFTVEQLEVSGNEAGGFKEIVFAVKGDGAYSVFKWEAGTHRVQRVPETESQGRIHTSTATVAVMPEAEEVEIEVDPSDLKIDVYRSAGPGGRGSLLRQAAGGCAGPAHGQAGGGGSRFGPPRGGAAAREGLRRLRPRAPLRRARPRAERRPDRRLRRQRLPARAARAAC